jgi:hypothetical protein
VTVFNAARDVADAVLYEGYLLYPYRASAAKNRARWQFGVLMPPAYVLREPSERSWSQTECLVEGRVPRLAVRVRFLQVQRRYVQAAAGESFQPVGALEVGDVRHMPWDEAVERESDLVVAIEELLDAPHEVAIAAPGGVTTEPVRAAGGSIAGRLIRSRMEIAGVLRLTAERLPGPYGLLRLRLRLENRTPWSSRPDGERAEALRRSMVAAHLLLSVAGGRFVSLLEPPEWAQGYAKQCENIGTFPILVGEEGRNDLMLSSPIILYDHPRVAPESPTDFFDATEIDELLSLRTLTLTDAEKREARGTDARAAAIIEHVEDMPPEVLDRLHGAMRQGVPESVPSAPWWNPGADASVSPETDSVTVAGVALCKGSKVLLRPGTRRADAQDMFLAGRPATIAAVFFDVDGETHVAVILDDDEAAAIQHEHGRFLYFSPDEVEPTKDVA